MRRLLPAFFQRRLLLSAARRALEAGRPEAALEILRDDLLAHDLRAAGVRALALPLIAQPPAPPKVLPPASGAASSGDLRDLLAQMRAKKSAEHESAGSSAPAAAVKDPAPAKASRSRPARLRLALDDAGSFLVCAGGQVIIGHSRAGEADIPVLADLSPMHARLVLQPASFHAGASWSIEALGASRVRVGEFAIVGGARVLQSGEHLLLGEHLRLLFEQPDRASESCTLTLESGVEAAGARRILLFAPGEQGRMRLGQAPARHVQAALGGVELELVHDGVRLWVRCASGLVPDESQGSKPLTELELPLHLQRAVHLRLCMPAAADRPRWISFAPLEDV
jgi:hypothetical protein